VLAEINVQQSFLNFEFVCDSREDASDGLYGKAHNLRWLHTCKVVDDCASRCRFTCFPAKGDTEFDHQ
jgi:hypothetical protein